MIYILWLNCIYIYKTKRKFPSAFSFAYRKTSKASSVFIFMNEHVKTYIQLCKYTVLNRGGVCAHTQFGGGSKTLFSCSNQALCFSFDKGHGPSESTIMLGNYIFELCGKFPMLEGRDRSPPVVTNTRGEKQLWPHRRCSHRPANLPGSPAQTPRCLFASASSGFLIPSTISLPGTFISLGWTSQCLVTAWESCAKPGWTRKLLHLVCLVCRMKHSKSRVIPLHLE